MYICCIGFASFDVVCDDELNDFAWHLYCVESFAHIE